MINSFIFRGSLSVLALNKDHSASRGGRQRPDVEGSQLRHEQHG